jgi:hypothetical protein
MIEKIVSKSKKSISTIKFILGSLQFDRGAANVCEACQLQTWLLAYGFDLLLRMQCRHHNNIWLSIFLARSCFLLDTNKTCTEQQS